MNLTGINRRKSLLSESVKLTKHQTLYLNKFQHYNIQISNKIKRQLFRILNLGD